MNIDKLITSNRWFKKCFRIRIEAFFHTTGGENIAFPAAASVAAGIICHNFSGSLMWLETTAAAVMLLSWVYSSFLSGFLKQWYFFIFSAAYNLLPYLFFNAAKTNPSEINKIFVEISNFLMGYGMRPLTSPGIEPFTVSASVAAGTGICMLIGFWARKNARSSREYCKVRLGMLGDGTEK